LRLRGASGKKGGGETGKLGQGMREAETFLKDTDELAQMLRVKMGVRGRGFASAFGRAKRRLPRTVRAEGRVLAEGLAMAEHPKLRQTLDFPRLKRAGTELRTHLGGIDLVERRKGALLNLLGVIAFNLLVVVTLFIVWLVWRGYV
jgi:hypothetical protein